MSHETTGCSRRDFLKKGGLYGLGLSAGLPFFLQRTSSLLAAPQTASAHPERILVVVELTGGNDGLNTVIPHSDDEYYRLRPKLGIPRDEVRKLDDDHGLHFILEGVESLYKDGNVAIVHGCGAPNPTQSHGQALQIWHTGVPNGADARGWLGRIADSAYDQDHTDLLVNIATSQSLAVRSEHHYPLVFKNPEQVQLRQGSSREQEVLARLSRIKPSGGNPGLSMVHDISSGVVETARKIKEVCADYETTVSYTDGSASLGLDLRNVAALIHDDFPTRIYYVHLAGFDTHVEQTGRQRFRLFLLDKAFKSFFADLKRTGRDKDVAMLVFTEFGRRPYENVGGGTDHGTATPVFLLGEPVKGGLYGKHPSLTDLTSNRNLKMTTDFRSIYSTVIREWMGLPDAKELLYGDFPTLGLFG